MFCHPMSSAPAITGLLHQVLRESTAALLHCAESFDNSPLSQNIYTLDFIGNIEETGGRLAH